MESYKKELSQYSDEVARWKKSTDEKFEEATNKEKAKHYEYLQHLGMWQKENDQDFQKVSTMNCEKMTEICSNWHRKRQR